MQVTPMVISFTMYAIIVAGTAANAIRIARAYRLDPGAYLPRKKAFTVWFVVLLPILGATSANLPFWVKWLALPWWVSTAAFVLAAVLIGAWAFIDRRYPAECPDEE